MSKLIAVIGNSGVGKTTLVKRLCAVGGFASALEQHYERPFQQAMAADRRRYALANQLDYLLYRAEQERALRLAPAVGLVDGGLDLDFWGFTRLFHHLGYLDDAELALCERQYRLLRALLPPPDLYLVLSAPPATVMRRFAARGRTLEIAARDDLQALDRLVGAFVAALDPADVIHVDAGADDFCEPRQIAALLAEIRRRVDSQPATDPGPV